MTEALPQQLKSARGWLAGMVITTGALAWVAIAWGAGKYLDYAGYLGVVGIAITVGSLDVAYLVWRNWALGQRGMAGAAAGGATLGSLLIFGATAGGVSAQGFVTMASAVGLMGLSTAAGLLGIYRATGKSTPATMTAMVIVIALAYFASVLWAAVP